MATVIEGRTGQSVYPDVVAHVLRKGRTRSPRGQMTLDAGTVIINLQCATNALPLGCGRSTNRNIAAAEAVQLVGGFSNPQLLLRASQAFAKFMNDGKFHGAYGERIKTQMLGVARKLHDDPSTRQAVVALWDGWLDNLIGKNDYPCTLAIQFERDAWSGALNMSVMMRSNDVWLGLPYDMFQFTQLQLTLANSLGVQAGSYQHVALSLHLYGTDVAKAERDMHNPTDFSMQPTGFGTMGQPFSEIMKRAQNVTTNVVNENETASEAWYRERFASYMGQDVDERGDGGGGEVAL
jgi:thymidylate synthase